MGDDGYGDLAGPARAALANLLDRSGPEVLGIVLTGSAARGVATVNSDVDLIVVSEQSAGEVSRSAAIDVIPMSMEELETVHPVGSAGGWVRWSFAWTRVLRDTPDGRVRRAVQRQAELSEAEVRDLLLQRTRLDEFLNFSYRAAKSRRDGQPGAARLDSAESVASFLDTVFALSGRVRPYNKYLVWEMSEHPLPDPNWDAATVLALVGGLLAGQEEAGPLAVVAIEAACHRHETLAAELAEVFEAWGPELALLRGQPR